MSECLRWIRAMTASHSSLVIRGGVPTPSVFHCHRSGHTYRREPRYVSRVVGVSQPGPGAASAGPWAGHRHKPGVPQWPWRRRSPWEALGEATASTLSWAVGKYISTITELSPGRVTRTW